MIYKLIQVANNSFLDLYMKYCTHLNVYTIDYSAEMEKKAYFHQKHIL